MLELDLISNHYKLRESCDYLCEVLVTRGDYLRSSILEFSLLSNAIVRMNKK
jgi:hypothetical protein